MAVATKAQRLASRTHIDADRRTRYRGQPTKGHPTAEANHAIDVRLAMSSLDRAHEMLMADVTRMETLERRENRRSAVALVAHAARALDDVLRREDQPLPDTRRTNRPAARR